MTRRSWTNSGFWLVLGLAAGMMISDLTSAQTLQARATGSASRYSDDAVVTSRSFDGQIDLVWLLDYRTATLNCILMNNNGKLQAAAMLDLLEQFELDDEQKPHFMLVAGGFSVRNTDLVYLAEVTTGQLLCVSPPNVAAGQRGARPQPVQVVDRFSYRAVAGVRPQ